MQSLTRTLASLFFAFALANACAAQWLPNPPGGPVGPPAPPANTVESDPKSWREFIPLGGGFSILFPGAPQTTRRAMHADGSGQSSDTFTYILKTFENFAVSYADYSTPPGDPAAARALFDKLGKTLSANFDAALVSQSDFTLDGHPGRLAAWRLRDGKILRAKALLAEQRLFTMLVLMPGGRGVTAQATRSYEEGANKFFDSFKLVPIARHVPVATPPGGSDFSRYLDEHKGEIFDARFGDPHDAPAGTSRVVPGKIVSQPQPAYPPIARAARAAGAVVVAVVVDEEGKVVAAHAVMGHPLLQQAAVRAARETRFTPSLLDGKPVKVKGVLTFNFDPK